MARSLQGHGSEPRITKANHKLIDAVVNGRGDTPEKLSEITGLSVRGVYKALSKDHIKAEIERQARQRLSGFALPKALHVMTDLLEAESEYVKADIAKHIAAIHGVKPTSNGTGVPGQGGGIAVRLVVNGQSIDFAAMIGVPHQDGNQPAQGPVIDHEPTTSGVGTGSDADA